MSVADRKNRTLTGGLLRTMLVDSKLPTTFWAEAVNTACYVLNRVLVIKPHNKTPYELIRGRPPLIDFMKPFGCPLTILNTRDHLGKFDVKVDEGYFVRYSVVSKAMRVFNKRTRIVEEKLNIRFLENTPNVKGNGPDCLFDVDSLSISMNYVPVAAGNKTNGIVGIKDNIVACQAQKEKEPEQEYILIPLCTTGSFISQTCMYATSIQGIVKVVPIVGVPPRSTGRYKKGVPPVTAPIHRIDMELKYNLFSVSQICDKKNNVLFTDTECLVLSSDFKLLDESQVLLRVPRKDNIYSVDLKSIVPTKGLTCLFAKATIDESNLWHRRLGHINFKNINKLVKGNLVRGLPSKIFENDHSCVACQKGKQHKASCKAKLVNSISKPLHMLHMDLFGPTNVKSLMKKSYCLVVTDDFSRFSWAEAVNTACYVLNRVLVIKPNSKTPYKLIRGKTPLIDFMKPFGCHVTILNTRDHLGKFDGKVDEGFFVGYSVVSKAMRVFNKRTRIVEETLNIRFLKNAPNVTGNGPDWLFNVDSLSKSMNYVLVVAGNQTNSIAETRDNIVAGQAKKKTDAEQEYILIPICITDPLISQGPKDSKEDVGVKPKEVDETEASNKDGKDKQDSRSEFERLLQQEKQTEHPNNTNSINTVSTPVSTVEPSSTNDAPSSIVNAAKTSEEHLFE
ncbi:ribonuclease H-like domain-containing protein [Tanacetum coccineum]